MLTQQTEWSNSEITRQEPHTILMHAAPDNTTINDTRRNGEAGDENVILNRIETVMSELTRMMDEFSRG
jgi:hypothetical protein